MDLFQNEMNLDFPGALFDHSSQETKAAFNYQIMKSNDNQGRLQLQSTDVKIDMSNAYAVTTASTYQMAN